ncbi:HTTM domain-containing protein [Symmachiella dynata]|uniref:HTTM domain-containing protein n=1 Tax=Symmachiella dynata TaxID=2527995 RepID=UPI0030ED3341
MTRTTSSVQAPQLTSAEKTSADSPADTAGSRDDSKTSEQGFNHVGRHRISERLLEELLSPVDNASLMVFRVAFGLAVAWYALRSLLSGSVAYNYIQPAMHFSFQGFEWIHPWPGAGMYFHFTLMLTAALCFAAGFCYRLSSVLVFLTFTFTFLCERSLYNNHYYLMSLLAFLSIFIPLHRRWSVDVFRSPEIASTYVPAWTVWLLRFQLGIVYFYGAVAKLNADWLQGQPMRMWLVKLSDYPVLGSYFTEEWAVQTFVWGGLLIDLFAVPLLLWRRSRLYAFAVIVLFHVINSTLFDIGVFPWLMIAVTTLFFSPDWPLRLAGQKSRSAPSSSPQTVRWTPKLRWGVALLSVYVLLQLVVPLRHHLYSGQTSWTENGHFFSWRMMLRNKIAAVRFYARNPETGREGIVDLRPYITPLQLSKMARDPNHILQMAHFLADDFRKQGLGNTEIRVKALASLNGRRPQYLIDPDVDLVKQQLGWLKSDWIVPLKEPFRYDAWDRPVQYWEEELGL